MWLIELGAWKPSGRALVVVATGSSAVVIWSVLGVPVTPGGEGRGIAGGTGGEGAVADEAGVAGIVMGTALEAGTVVGTALEAGVGAKAVALALRGTVLGFGIGVWAVVETAAMPWVCTGCATEGGIVGIVVAPFKTTLVDFPPCMRATLIIVIELSLMLAS